jgi:hypothetical protein
VSFQWNKARLVVLTADLLLHIYDMNNMKLLGELQFTDSLIAIDESRSLLAYVNDGILGSLHIYDSISQRPLTIIRYLSFC